ncbi:MAG: hypothetical protein AAF754_19225 [Pseudomonadota bacterium]
MAKNYKTQLAGQIGESLVVAELGRRMIVATAFSGNVPDIDILAFANNNTLHMQVKATRHVTTQFDAAKYLNIVFEGERQSVLGLNDGFDRDLVHVFVKIGIDSKTDRFFVLEQKDLQAILHDNHGAWLAKHNGIRPRNQKSTHVALKIDSLAVFEDNWQLIERRLGLM